MYIITITQSHLKSFSVLSLNMLMCIQHYKIIITVSTSILRDRLNYRNFAIAPKISKRNKEGCHNRCCMNSRMLFHLSHAGTQL